MRLVGTSRRALLWVGLYLVALFMILVFLAGTILDALVLVLAAEVFFFLFGRAMPVPGPSSYEGPTPAGWQLPIRALRWSGLIHNGCSLAFVSVLGTLILVFLIIVTRPRALGLGNFVVGGLLAGWLLTRPLLAPLLRKSVGPRLRGVKRDVSRLSPWISVGPDGIYFELRFVVIGARPQRRWVFHVTFDEIDEMQTLDYKDAQAYAQSMQTYDPTFNVRAQFELNRYYYRPAARPSILELWNVGTNLLVRGSTFLYLIGGADETAPGAVAAWQTWRATHDVPKGPSA